MKCGRLGGTPTGGMSSEFPDAGRAELPVSTGLDARSLADEGKGLVESSWGRLEKGLGTQ